MGRATLLVFTTLAATALAAAPVHASVPGAVVVAKSRGNAVLIWQATPFVDALNAKHEPQNQALAELESSALGIIADHRAILKNATSVSLKVLITNAAPQSNPHYAPTTFSGFEQILVLNVTGSALRAFSSWPKNVDPQHLPAGVTASIAAQGGGV